MTPEERAELARLRAEAARRRRLALPRVGRIGQGQPGARPQGFGSRLASAGALGAATGGVFGGPVGMITGGLGGLAGELSAEYSRRMGGGPLAQTASGFMGDLVTSVATRRPTAGMMSHLGRWSFSDVPATAMAGRQLRALDVPEEALTSSYGPEDAVRGIERAYGRLEGDERRAWEAFRATDPESQMVPTQGIQDAGGVVARRLQDTPESPAILGRVENLPGEISMERLQNLRSSVGETVEMAAVPGKSRHALVRSLYGPIEQAPRQAGVPGQVVETWEDAIGASARKHAAVPRKSEVWRQIFNPQRAETYGIIPEQAMQAIVRRGPNESRRLMALLEGDEVAQLGARRAALQRIYGRIYGGTGNVPRTAGALLERTSADYKALEPILGANTLDRIRENALGIYQTIKPAGERMNPTVRLAQALGLGPVAAGGAGGAGAGATYALLTGQVEPATAAAVGTLATVPPIVRSIVRRYDPNVARNLFLQALNDPDLAEKLMRKAGRAESVALADRIIQAAVRRGVLLEDEVEPIE